MALPEQWTEDDYLAFERENDRKHEFIGGQVVAMTGASEAHNLIAVNLITVLKTQMRGRPCKVYPGDMRMKVTATGLYAYPDVSVVCGDSQFTDGHLDTLTNLTILFEILSPSTERCDRGVKFQHYREIPGLREYVLVAQDSARIEHYSRQVPGWHLNDVRGLKADLVLPAIQCTLSLEDIYDQVGF